MIILVSIFAGAAIGLLFGCILSSTGKSDYCDDCPYKIYYLSRLK